MRFEKPSEIQASTLPLILAGHNVIAQAQSGAGECDGHIIAIMDIPSANQFCREMTCSLPI